MPDLKYRLSLSIPANKPFIELVGKTLDSIVVLYNFNVEELSDLYMAVKEAISRAVVHNRLENIDENIDITFYLYTDKIIIDIKIASNIKEGGLPKIDTYDSIGFSFINSIVDEFRFFYKDKQKIFHIIKKA